MEEVVRLLLPQQRRARSTSSNALEPRHTLPRSAVRHARAAIPLHRVVLVRVVRRVGPARRDADWVDPDRRRRDAVAVREGCGARGREGRRARERSKGTADGTGEHAWGRGRGGVSSSVRTHGLLHSRRRLSRTVCCRVELIARQRVALAAARQGRLRRVARFKHGRDLLAQAGPRATRDALSVLVVVLAGRGRRVHGVRAGDARGFRALEAGRDVGRGGRGCLWSLAQRSLVTGRACVCWVLSLAEGPLGTRAEEMDAS